jgi:hypothetical protein
MQPTRTDHAKDGLSLEALSPQEVEALRQLLQAVHSLPPDGEEAEKDGKAGKADKDRKDDAGFFWHYVGPTLLAVAVVLLGFLYYQVNANLQQARHELRAVMEQNSKAVRREDLARSVGAVDSRVKEIRAANLVAAEFLDRQAQAQAQADRQAELFKSQIEELRRDLTRARERVAALEAARDRTRPTGDGKGP